MSLQLDNNVITPNSIIANLYSRKQACASNLLDSDSKDFADCLKDQFNSSSKEAVSQNKETDKNIEERIETKAENLLKSSLREIQTTMNYALNSTNLAQNLYKNYGINPAVTTLATQAVSYML